MFEIIAGDAEFACFSFNRTYYKKYDNSRKENIMKKGLFLLCVVSAASIFAGCGTSEEAKQSETTQVTESSDPIQFGTDTENEAYQFPYTALDYVTPGEYTGLTVEDVAVAEVAEGDIQTENYRRMKKQNYIQRKNKMRLKLVTRLMLP